MQGEQLYKHVRICLKAVLCRKQFSFLSSLYIEDSSCAMITNYNLLIPISMQPDVVNLDISNYDLCRVNELKFEISKGLRH